MFHIFSILFSSFVASLTVKNWPLQPRTSPVKLLSSRVVRIREHMWTASGRWFSLQSWSWRRQFCGWRSFHEFSTVFYFFRHMQFSQQRGFAVQIVSESVHSLNRFPACSSPLGWIQIGYLRTTHGRRAAALRASSVVDPPNIRKRTFSRYYCIILQISVDNFLEACSNRYQSFHYHFINLPSWVMNSKLLASQAQGTVAYKHVCGRRFRLRPGRGKARHQLERLRRLYLRWRGRVYFSMQIG